MNVASTRCGMCAKRVCGAAAIRCAKLAARFITLVPVTYVCSNQHRAAASPHEAIKIEVNISPHRLYAHTSPIFTSHVPHLPNSIVSARMRKIPQTWRAEQYRILMTFNLKLITLVRYTIHIYAGQVCLARNCKFSVYRRAAAIALKNIYDPLTHIKCDRIDYYYYIHISI